MIRDPLGLHHWSGAGMELEIVMEPTQCLPQIVVGVGIEKRKDHVKFFELRMVSDLSSSAVAKTQFPWVSCPPTFKLESVNKY